MIYCALLLIGYIKNSKRQEPKPRTQVQAIGRHVCPPKPMFVKIQAVGKPHHHCFCSTSLRFSGLMHSRPRPKRFMQPGFSCNEPPRLELVAGCMELYGFSPSLCFVAVFHQCMIAKPFVFYLLITYFAITNLCVICLP